MSFLATGKVKVGKDKVRVIKRPVIEMTGSVVLVWGGLTIATPKHSGRTIGVKTVSTARYKGHSSSHTLYNYYVPSRTEVSRLEYSTSYEV